MRMRKHLIVAALLATATAASAISAQAQNPQGPMAMAVGARE